MHTHTKAWIFIFHLFVFTNLHGLLDPENQILGFTRFLIDRLSYSIGFIMPEEGNMRLTGSIHSVKSYLSFAFFRFFPSTPAYRGSSVRGTTCLRVLDMRASSRRFLHSSSSWKVILFPVLGVADSIGCFRFSDFSYRPHCRRCSTWHYSEPSQFFSLWISLVFFFYQPDHNCVPRVLVCAQ